MTFKKFYKYLKETTVKEAFIRLLISFAFYIDSNVKYKKAKKFFNRLMNDNDYRLKKFFDFFMLFLVIASVGILLYDIKHDLNPYLEDFDFI